MLCPIFCQSVVVLLGQLRLSRSNILHQLLSLRVENAIVVFWFYSSLFFLLFRFNWKVSDI